MSAPNKLPVLNNVPISEIIKSLNQQIDGHNTQLFMYPLSTEPSTKQLGMVVFADGVSWNPGNGAGIYWYDGTNWIFAVTPNEVPNLLAAVASSGDYGDLSNTPNLAAVATSGSYTDLSNTPSIEPDLGDPSADGFILSSTAAGGRSWVPNPLSFRNKIINGGMDVDERQDGALITPATGGVYTIDRWKSFVTVASQLSFQQNYNSVAAPPGFSSYLGISNNSAYSPLAASDYFLIMQQVEGYIAQPFAWGSSEAKTAVLSFWVQSSVTGEFSGSFRDNAVSITYPFTFTINSADTWEYKTVVIPGATAGTWGTRINRWGLLTFSLGVGSTYTGSAGTWQSGNFVGASGTTTNFMATSGATFYITGVQLEAGSIATPFEQRPIGLELSLCLRYCEVLNSVIVGSYRTSSGEGSANWLFKVRKRVAPTVTLSGDSQYDGMSPPRIDGIYDYADATAALATFGIGSIADADF